MKSARLPGSGEVTRLTVLSLLSSHPMHGYEIRQLITQRRINQWADIKPGSIYASLERFTREGLIEAIETSQTGKRPVRTVYRITGTGRVKLQSLLREAWARPRMTASLLDIALSFVDLLPKEKILILLEQRQAAIDILLLDAEDAQHRAKDQAPMSAFTEDLFEHQRRKLIFEREWASHLIERVRSGAYSSPAEKNRENQNLFQRSPAVVPENG